jgi:predicted DCC family thiol-disulfide oxidoreductase YuxK
MTQTLAPAPEPPALPSPAQRPHADVVVYDGHCGFCTAQVKNLLWWDCQGKLAYLSLHDPEVQRQWPDLDHDRLLQEMLIIDSQGRRHWGPEAIRYLTHRLRRLWWAAPVFYIPGVMFVWRRMYRWIARNRYRISAHTCDSGTCELHLR